MTVFEYLLVLVSIIVGLGITHVLSGIGRIISHPGQTRIYWIHLLWVGWAFLWLIFFWWFEFQRSLTETWTPEIYLFLVLYSVLLYLLCVILLPTESPEGADYREYFHSRRLWIFGILVCVILVDAIDSWSFGDFTTTTLAIPFIGVRSVQILFLLLAARSSNERFHGTLGIFNLWIAFSLFLWGGLGPQAIDGIVDIGLSLPTLAVVVTLVLATLLIVSTAAVFFRPLDTLLSRIESVLSRAPT